MACLRGFVLNWMEATLSAASRSGMKCVVGLICLMILVGAARIALCYSVYSPVIDEPPTLAAGIELLDRGKYTLETLHPPLARVLSASLPYALGLRSTGKANIWKEGEELFKRRAVREEILPFARLGNLLPFVVASIIVGIWGYQCGGKSTAIGAVFLFTTQPIILGHSIVATLDMSCAAFTATALFSFWCWLAKPTCAKSVCLGAATAASLLSKSSSAGFLLLGGALFIAVATLSSSQRRCPTLGLIKQIGVAFSVCTFVIWMGYGFSFHPLKGLHPRSIDFVDQVIGRNGNLHGLFGTFANSVPIPAPEFVDCLLQLPGRNQEGHLNYMLGEVRTDGWLCYYPLRLLLKTPLAFIVLTYVGAATVLKGRIGRANKNEGALFAVIGALAILDVGMLSSVNNGLRQLLAIYPLFAIIASMGCAELCGTKRRWPFWPVVAFGLLAWHGVSSVSAHPGYLSYFNELAGGRPEQFAADSDIDWAQDLNRMMAALKRLGAEDVAINVRTGIVGLDQYELPSWRLLQPNMRTEGWIVISVGRLKLGTGVPPFDQYAWLEEMTPVEKIGNSIFIYQIPRKDEFPLLETPPSSQAKRVADRFYNFSTPRKNWCEPVIHRELKR